MPGPDEEGYPCPRSGCAQGVSGALIAPLAAEATAARMVEALSDDLDLRRQVRRAAYTVGRVATSENPNLMVRLRALGILSRPERLVAGKALRADLCCQYALHRLLRLCGRSRQVTEEQDPEGEANESQHVCPPRNVSDGSAA